MVKKLLFKYIFIGRINIHLQMINAKLLIFQNYQIFKFKFYNY